MVHPLPQLERNFHIHKKKSLKTFQEIFGITTSLLLTHLKLKKMKVPFDLAPTHLPTHLSARLVLMATAGAGVGLPLKPKKKYSFMGG